MSGPQEQQKGEKEANTLRIAEDELHLCHISVKALFSIKKDYQMFTGDPRRANPILSPILPLKIAMYGGKVSRFWNQIGLGLKPGSFGNQLQQVPALNHYSTSAHPLFHPLLEQSVSSRLYQPSQ